MRIAQLLSGQGHGAAYHCAMLTAELSRRGHQVVLLVRSPAHFQSLDLGGAELLQASFRRSPAEFRRVVRLLRERQIDVVHTHVSSAHSYGALLRLFAGMRVVATAHARHIQIHWPLNHRVIAPSASTAAYHHSHNFVPWRRLSVIHNFVEAKYLPPPEHGRRAAMRAALGIPADAFVMGSVGHIDSRKNQSGLAKVLVRLKALGVDAYLVLVGNKGREEARMAEAEAAAGGLSDRLILTGRRSDVRDLLTAFDVFVMNSRKEELPIALIEAMAMELPVVSTAVGGIPELVVEGTGHLVRHGEIDALAAHVAALARAPERRAAFGAAGRARVIAELHPDNVVPRIEAVYAEVARK
jgi:glycosyltransferase involved in cell wall biosynthesis